MNNNETNNGLNSQVLGGSTDNTISNPTPQSNPVVNETPAQATTVESVPVGSVNTSQTINPVNNQDNAYHAATPESAPAVNANGTTASPQNPTPNNAQAATTPVEPAYTNPQTINPTPNTGMPGFESSSVIGTTPPVSLEPEKKPKKKGGNKILFIILILVVIAAVGGGTYYLLNSGILNSSSKVSIETKDVSLNLGDAIPTDVSTYATVSGTTISNCSINVDSVDNYTEGTYSYSVTCGEEVKSGTITIVDNTELVISTQTVYKAIGDTIDPSEFVVDVDSNVTYTFVNSADVDTAMQTAGTYTVQIQATSGSKTATNTATLVVLTTGIKGYVTCKSSEEVLTDISASVVVKERFALLDDDNNSYSGIAQEIYEYTFTDQEVYNNYVNEYYANGSLVINNITGSASFNDTDLIIELTNDLDNDNVIASYGEDNMNNYSTITSYFVNQKGYKCSYSKAE